MSEPGRELLAGLLALRQSRRGCARWAKKVDEQIRARFSAAFWAWFRWTRSSLVFRNGNEIDWDDDFLSYCLCTGLKILCHPVCLSSIGNQIEFLCRTILLSYLHNIDLVVWEPAAESLTVQKTDERKLRLEIFNELPNCQTNRSRINWYKSTVEKAADLFSDTSHHKSS